MLDLTAEERKFYEDEPGEDSPDLPDDALVICGRLGEQFQLIRCNDRNDSPVWYYAEWAPNLVKRNESVYNWLNDFCDESIGTIKSGYFKKNPKGTTP